MASATDIQASVSKLGINMGRLDQIVNGDKNTVVVTDNGPVPSIAKAINDRVGAASGEWSA